jgi:hypothetical protein
MKTNTRVINYFAGPGAGKSTTATGVFSRLKQMGIICEYVSEYAKDITWEETPKLLTNQIHVFAEQFRRQWRLIDKVDFIITDSPIFLSSVYYKFYNEKNGNSKFTPEYDANICKMFEETFIEFNNINFYIQRNKPYINAGRVQSYTEAEEIDTQVKTRLRETGIEFCETNSLIAIEDTLAYLKDKKLIE